MLIEKGIDLSQLPLERKFVNIFPWLKTGIVVAFMGLGLLFGNADNNPGVMMGCVFLFGGIGMILANYLDKPKAQK